MKDESMVDHRAAEKPRRKILHRRLFEYTLEKTFRYRYHIAYAILGLLVAYAWWTNVISVYLTKANRAAEARRLAESLKNAAKVPKGLPAGTQKIVVLTCLFELYSVPAYCLFKEVCGCSYWLPVSILAWRRLGYKALVFVVGAQSGPLRWKQRGAYWYALEMMERLGDVQVQEIDVVDEKFFTKAERLARLFAAKYVKNSGDPYILFADVTTFPLTEPYFEPAEGQHKGIMVISPKIRCCKRFLLSGQVIKLLPQGTMVGMLASNWREVVVDKAERLALEKTSGEEEEEEEVSDKRKALPELKKLYGKYLAGRHLGQIGQAQPDRIILSIMIHEWLKTKGDISKGIDKKFLFIRQPPGLDKPQDEEDFGGDDAAENIFRDFPLAAQTISGWSEVYPIAAELFDPAWIDLTEYWINFTNVVNAEPNIRPEMRNLATPSFINGVRFLPLILTPPPKSRGADSEAGGNGFNPDKQEDFQYVAFFDEDDKR